MFVTAMPAPISNCLRFAPARSRLRWVFPTGRTRFRKTPARPGARPPASRPVFLPPLSWTGDRPRAAVLENATLIPFAGFTKESGSQAIGRSSSMPETDHPGDTMNERHSLAEKTQVAVAADPPVKLGNRRWTICALLFFA